MKGQSFKCGIAIVSNFDQYSAFGFLKLVMSYKRQSDLDSYEKFFSFPLAFPLEISLLLEATLSNQYSATDISGLGTRGMIMLNCSLGGQRQASNS